jgi:hypothetical protein
LTAIARPVVSPGHQAALVVPHISHTGPADTRGDSADSTDIAGTEPLITAVSTHPPPPHGRQIGCLNPPPRKWVRVQTPPRAPLLIRPNVNFHDLRHTYATLALKAGIHPKVVSERLGHATVGITLDLYSHVTPSIAREAADVVAAGIFS